MSCTTDVMLDLEYLAGCDNAVITQITMVPFNIETGEAHLPTITSFNAFPDVGDQLRSGRAADQHTMLWWMRQCHEQETPPAWIEANGPVLAKVLMALRQWWGNLLGSSQARLWSHVRCDMGKLMHAYDQINMPHPWHPKQEWHLQTLRGLALGMADVEGDQDFISEIQRLRDKATHDALEDCLVQIAWASKCWAYIHPNLKIG